MKYVIYNKDEDLFWNNEIGWAPFSLGSRFSSYEFSMLNLPLEGEWYVAKGTKKETLLQKNKVDK